MDGKKAAEKLIDALQLEENEYRVGTTKVKNRPITLLNSGKPCSDWLIQFKTSTSPCLGVLPSGCARYIGGYAG